MKHTIAFVIFVTGCSFNPGGSKDDLGSNGDNDMGSAAGDLGDEPDLSPVCTPGDSTCTGGMLSVCNPDGTGVDTTACVIGCNTAGVDCLALQPTAPAVASDFVYAGLKEPTLTQPLLVFDADTGEIQDGAGASVRMPNVAPGSRGVENGIGFHVASGVGIWTFAKLTIPASTLVVFKHSAASAGVSILSASDLTVAGTIDARGYMDPTQALMATSTLCVGTVAGPGGTIGGSGPTNATGTGAGGSVADALAGGGGGGYGDVGGAGGKHGGTNGGTAGAVAGAAAISPLLGGFGGGSSGTAGTTNGNGGGGGAALQLAAQGTISVSGGINAGGCGGAPGDATHGGGGGGAGGGILVEAPTINVAATGKLAANGGGGGGGGDVSAAPGKAGDLTSARAAGGTATGAANGGGGGAGANPTGSPGDNGNGAGGGGGAVGRVRFNTRTGSTTPDPSAVISPPASQGTVVIQ